MSDIVTVIRKRCGARPLDDLRHLEIKYWSDADLDYHAPGWTCDDVDGMYLHPRTFLLTVDKPQRKAFNRRVTDRIRSIIRTYTKRIECDGLVAKELRYKTGQLNPAYCDQDFYDANPEYNPLLEISPRVVAMYGFGSYLLGTYDPSFGLTKGSRLPNNGAITRNPSMRFYCPIRDTVSVPQVRATMMSDVDYLLGDNGTVGRALSAFSTATAEHMTYGPYRTF